MPSYKHTFTSGQTVTPARLNDARDVFDIVNADIKSDAAIAGTKIAPDFGSQTVSSSAACINTTSTDGFVNIGSGSGQFPNSLVLYPSSHATSRRASIFINDWGLLQDNVGNGTKDFVLYQASANAVRVAVNTSGTILVGKTVDDIPTVGCVISGAGYGRFSMADGVPIAINRNTNGQIQNFRRSDAQIGSISVTTTATAFNTSSDYRLKQNIEPMTGGLAKLSALAPKTFEFINEPNVKVDGFIAHEVQAVVPIAVTGEKDGEEMQGLDHSKLVPVLVAAVQELSAKVAALEAA
jgi:hypothetical protein